MLQTISLSYNCRNPTARTRRSAVKIETRFEEHLNTFYGILGKLTPFDKSLNVEYKKAELIRHVRKISHR